jgi:hypothetical protein
MALSPPSDGGGTTANERVAREIVHAIASPCVQPITWNRTRSAQLHRARRLHRDAAGIQIELHACGQPSLPPRVMASEAWLRHSESKNKESLARGYLARLI